MTESLISRLDNQVSCDLDGETVLLHLDSGKYYQMDAIGSKIWELLEQPRSLSYLCDNLLKDFEVESEQCKQDVLEYLNDLQQAGLVNIEAE